MKVSKSELAYKMDFSPLHFLDTEEDVKKCCEIARNYKFGGITVFSKYVSLAKECLKGSGIKVGGVLVDALPSDLLEYTGQTKVASLVRLARQAIEGGADHVEFWINIAAAKDGDYDRAKRDLENTVKAIRAIKSDIVIMAILETGYFMDEKKVKLAKMIKGAGVDFLKTASSLEPIGITVHDIKLIRKTIGPHMGIKAAGIIRNTNQALALLRAGADRLSVSRGPQLVDELNIK